MTSRGPTTFAVNTMAIATPVDPTDARDLAGRSHQAGVKVAVCQQDVPCGAAAEKLFATNGSP